MNVRPNIVRTTTSIPVLGLLPPQTCTLRSKEMPGRVIKLVRTDGIDAPLHIDDVHHVTQRRFVEGQVQHFCSYVSGAPVRYDAVLVPQRFDAD